MLGAIRREVGVANGVFHRSSDGRRRLRVVTDGRCDVAVDRVTLSPGQLGSFTETIKALRASGHARIDRKYLLFVDTHGGCGLAEQYLDDGAAVNNRTTTATCSPPSTPRAGRASSPRTSSPTASAASSRALPGRPVARPLHRPAHVLPRRLRQAESLVVTSKQMTVRCDSRHATLLDCGRDDYVSVAQLAGSYLATYWNTASNSFLVGGGPALPTPPSAPTAVTSSRSGDVVRIGWGTPDQAGSGLTAFHVVDLAASGRLLTSVGGGAARRASR